MNTFRKLSLVLSFAFSVAVGCGSPASDPPPPTLVEQVPTAELKGLLALGETRLTEVEAMVAGMGAKTIITMDDNTHSTDVMDDYSATMQDAYAAMRRDVNQAGESSGQRGSGESAQLFETIAQNHEGRWMVLNKQAEILTKRVQKGAVTLDRAILAQMTEDQRLEFSESLTEEGLAKNQQLHPDLFPPMTISHRLLRGGEMMAGAARQLCHGLPQNASSLLIGTAEARVILSCVGPCISARWADCVACVAKSVPDVVQAVRDTETCWKRASWFIPKIGCIFKLIGVLA